MGSYIYKVTAERVKLDAPVTLSDGRVTEFANVAKYAFKPYMGWGDADAENRRMAKQAAVHVAERFVKGKNYTGLVTLDGIRVYEWKQATMVDDYMADRMNPIALIKPKGDPEKSEEVNEGNMEVYEHDLRDMVSLAITGKGWYAFAESVKGNYTPSVEGSRFEKWMIEKFVASFKEQFGREPYVY
jgi:hypothetical protein